ncbi:MAG: cation diffusion facilitator family transporter, partial [Gemmatimonadota bacterium]|nr:cation diffusion facilitator family transporter [Gemmatimonadota bacterium]
MHNHSHAGHSHPGHSHSDPHGESPVRSLRIALALTGTLLVAEVVGGFMSNSIALLADAGHMLTDVAALSLSLFVAWFTRQPSTPQKSFGYLRWEILAAFLNGGALILISVAIIVESVMRLGSPQPIEGGLMLLIAICGLTVNIIAAA